MVQIRVRVLLRAGMPTKYGSSDIPAEIDIYRSARLLIDQHGEDAPIFAAMQADKLAEAGDRKGRAVWLRVIRTIEELQRTRPRRDEPIH